MGLEKEFSLDNQYSLDELKAMLKNLPENVKVTLELSQVDEKKPFVEASGIVSTEEIAKIIDERKRTLHASSQKDELTGLYNRDYFEKRINTIDRSQVLPVAIINFNINNWKFVNDNFGDEESDRLIRIIADIIDTEAKPYFVTGRMDGDIFGVLIPMATEGEAEFFIQDVKDRCLHYEDDILAPSVAAGIVYKTNVEQSIETLMSDAEYAMFDDKFQTKNAPGYQERLEHGLNNFNKE